MSRSTEAVGDLPLVLAPVRGRLTAGAMQTSVMTAAVPMVGSAVLLAATSDHVARPRW